MVHAEDDIIAPIRPCYSILCSQLFYLCKHIRQITGSGEPLNLITLDLFQVLAGNFSKVASYMSEVLQERQDQELLVNVSRLPFIHKWIAVMPDVHVGKGVTIGSVILTRGGIIPAAVGSDIGCGMMVVRTSLQAGDLPDNLASMCSAIEQAVPHGRRSKSTFRPT